MSRTRRELGYIFSPRDRNREKKEATNYTLTKTEALEASRNGHRAKALRGKQSKSILAILALPDIMG